MHTFGPPWQTGEDVVTAGDSYFILPVAPGR